MLWGCVKYGTAKVQFWCRAALFRDGAEEHNQRGGQTEMPTKAKIRRRNLGAACARLEEHLTVERERTAALGSENAGLRQQIASLEAANKRLEQRTQAHAKKE